MTYTPALSIRRVSWPTRETINDFVPTEDNDAGDYDFASDGTFLCGKATRGQTLLWSTTDVWTMTWVGGTFAYSFERVGTNCGIISQRAAVVLDTGACWMGLGRFYKFDGFVNPIDCEVSDFVFNDFNYDFAHTVFAYANPQFGEIWWHYPSADSETPDRYVVYNYQEQHWSFGSMDRVAGIQRQAGSATPVPVLIDSDGNIFDHETGDDRGDDPVFLESGPMEVGEGDNVVRVQQIIPDDKTLGDVQASFYTSFYPDETEVLHGPYTLHKQTSVRFTARQIRLRLEEVKETAWRVGVVRLGAIIGGRR